MSVSDFTNDLDVVLQIYGVKYVFVESGKLSIAAKISEIYGDSIPNPIDANAKYWCEISWGSGEEDMFDLAVNSFGNTLGEAIRGCLTFFQLLVKEGDEGYVAIAKHFNIHQLIMEQ